MKPPLYIAQAPHKMHIVQVLNIVIPIVDTICQSFFINIIKILVILSHRHIKK